MKYVHGWAYPDFDEFMTTEMSIDGTYQRSHLDAAMSFVTNWDLAVDGGAHVGTWSAILSKRFAHVISFEPSHDTHDALIANKEAFGWSNVTVKNVALGEAEATGTMDLDEANRRRANTGARFLALNRPAVESSGPVSVVTLDSLDLRSLGFLKLDVEGSEHAALLGARKTLKRCRPVILYEDKKLGMKHFGLPRFAVRDLLVRLGYQHLMRAGCDEIWGPR